MKYHPILMLATDHRLDGPSARPTARGSRSVARGLPRVGTPEFAHYAGRLGDDIAEHGLARYEVAVARIARLARRHGATPVAAEVLEDRSAPAVLRERALSVVTYALAAIRVAGDRETVDAA